MKNAMFIFLFPCILFAQRDQFEAEIKSMSADYLFTLENGQRISLAGVQLQSAQDSDTLLAIVGKRVEEKVRDMLVGRSVFVELVENAEDTLTVVPAYLYYKRLFDRGALINADMLKRGYGKMLAVGDSAISVHLSKAEAKAREVKSGIWNPQDYLKESESFKIFSFHYGFGPFNYNEDRFRTFSVQIERKGGMVNFKVELGNIYSASSGYGTCEGPSEFARSYRIEYDGYLVSILLGNDHTYFGWRIGVDWYYENERPWCTSALHRQFYPKLELLIGRINTYHFFLSYLTSIPISFGNNMITAGIEWNFVDKINFVRIGPLGSTELKGGIVASQVRIYNAITLDVQIMYARHLSYRVYDRYINAWYFRTGIGYVLD